ncbi:hypothetical protein FI667_g11856, partial [Globisporangium splendens]
MMEPMAKNQKKSTHDALAAGDAVSALPRACVQQIFYCANDQRVTNLIRHEACMPDGNVLNHMAQVCKAWADLSGAILLERQTMSLRIDIRSGNTTEMEAAVQQIRLRGSKLKDLQLAMGVMSADHNLELYDGQADIEAAVVDWDAVFKHCVYIWRLDLSRVPLHSKHLKAMIDAAANYCNEIQSLILPRMEHPHDDTKPSLQTTFVSLYSALQKWYSHGGLRQLTIPQRCEEPSTKFVEYTNEYLTAVSKYCPNLEYFDGWSVTYEETEYIECEELLFCNNSAWSEFCRGCSKLREVNWFTIPYAGDFFRTFAKHKKPWLTNLTLAGGPPEKWSEELAGGSYYAGGEFEHTKEDVLAVLEACPQLQTLSILFYNSESEVMRHEDFDDEFLIQLAQKCQHLHTFRYDELESGQPICENRMITDIGLGALAAMPNLSSLYSKQVNCSGVGIFAFVSEMPRPMRRRKIEIVVGDANQKDFVRFYSVLLELLACFIRQDQKEIEDNRFELHVYRQCVSRDSVAQHPDLVAQFIKARREFRSRYESLLKWSLGGQGWEVDYDESSPDSLQSSIGNARELALRSIK